jgi:hypothetical protein
MRQRTGVRRGVPQAEGIRNDVPGRYAGRRDGTYTRPFCGPDAPR